MKNAWKNTKNLLERLPIAALLLLLSLGARAQNLNTPLGVAVDAKSNIYVANLYGGVTVYGPGFGKKTTITQGVDTASSVAVGPDGTIYVANLGSNLITEYSPNGYTQTALTIPVNQPEQVVIGSYNEVYVVEAGGAVNLYDPLGVFRAQVNVVDTQTLVVTSRFAQFWVANQSSSPSAAEYQMFTVDIAANLNGFFDGAPYNGFLPARAVGNPKTGVTWITDLVNQQVLTVDPSGNVTVKIKPASPPYGIALDMTKQRIYVTEPEANQVEVFSMSTLQRVGLLK